MARILAVLLIAALGVGALQPVAQAGLAERPAAAPAAQATCNGTWYQVQQGDSWSRVSQRTGVSVAALKAANPEAARHPQGWLLVNQRLCVPNKPGRRNGVWITVRSGDSWAILSTRYGVGLAALQQANPQVLRPNEILRVGDRIWIPGEAAKAAQVDCAEKLEDYPDLAADVLVEAGGILEVLRTYLAGCGVVTSDWGAVETLPLEEGQSPGIVLVLAESGAGSAGPSGMLAVLAASDTGWDVLYRTGVLDGVTLQLAGDVNEDGRPDVTWSDTTCGAEDCFTTLHVLTYLDGRFVPWIDDGAVMANAQVTLENSQDAGSGMELQMSGGVIKSVRAGPQRQVTKTWASIDGGPYRPVAEAYAPSFCLYHQILDANALLSQGREDDFAAAIEAYRQAVHDPALVACWVWPDEMDDLRAFGLYRLAVAEAYAGDSESATATVTELQARFPEHPYTQLAELWWIAYQGPQDARAACAAVTVFARSHPEVWQRLADYGYGNPTFSPEAVCPLVP